MITSERLALLFVLVSIAAVTAQAKGSPNKIIIRGAGLAQPIEITERETLRGFDPWLGQFIDWSQDPVAPPPNQGESFEVLFYMKWPGRRSRYDLGKLKLIYSVRYCVGRNGEPGYIFLPDNLEGTAEVNRGTIIRDGDDGKWHPASAAWNALIQRLLRGGNRNQAQ